jgi:hypothetical protein
MLLTHLNVGDHVKLSRIARRSSYVSYALVPTASAIVDAADILVRQDVRDVGDLVEKFTGTPPGCREGTSRSGTSSSEWGPPLDRPTSEAAFAT